MIYEEIYPSYNDTAYATRKGIRYIITSEGIVGKDSNNITFPYGFVKTTYSCLKYLIGKNDISQKYDKEEDVMKYYDTSGLFLFSKKLHRAYPFKNGLTFFELSKNGGFGIMNSKGKTIVNPNKKWIWIYNGGFNNNIAIIKSISADNEIEFIYINNKGKIIHRGSYYQTKSEDSY